MDHDAQGRESRTVNVALALVRLRDEQVGHMSADMVLVADGVAAEDLLQSVVHAIPVSLLLLPSSGQRGGGKR